ncbi:unnamed protein product [Paramecium primaurelia]|uniref:Rhodanese domain-containing protein n=1 Tax=Paramecium primaurelia TaxID=5886 RepID=A0A8S1MM11_PARPR|nr:unnamed protein product [Paramecium primaurelia]
MNCSSNEMPNFLPLFKTCASLSSFDCDSNHSTKRFGDELLLLSPTRSQQLSNPNKKIVIGDDSWLRRGISISSETSSPDRQFERQEFFSSFRVPVNFCEENDGLNRLQHFEKDAVNYITSETLYKNANDITLFDCRYKFEFEGGHIHGATHLCNPFEIESIFFKQIPTVKPVIVLYCEFSEKRSVQIYKQIRNTDRNLNQYPNLHYPDLYILNKGFSNYSLEYPSQIQGKYIRMDSKEYSTQYKEQKCQTDNQWNSLKLKKRLQKINI